MNIGNKLIPGETSDGDIFSSTTGFDGMTFVLKSLNHIGGPETNCTVWATVVFEVSLAITYEASLGNSYFRNGEFGDTTIRDIDLDNVTWE